MSESELRANYNGKEDITKTRSRNVEDLNTHTVEGGSRAPTGLLAEFLSSVMIKDYEMAFKYCAEILSFEPNNTTARDFYPLILEKLELISNEEYDDSSSSDSFSSDSKLSGSSLSQVGSPSSDDDKRFSSGDETSSLERKTAVKAINDTLATNFNVGERPARNKNKGAAGSRRRFTPTKGSSVRTGSTKENFVKTHSKEKLQRKAADSGSPLPSEFLIHPTKTKILKSSSVLKEEKKKQCKTKKMRYRDQETSQNQSSSKILLYPTRTITFPKVISESKLSND